MTNTQRLILTPFQTLLDTYNWGNILQRIGIDKHSTFESIFFLLITTCVALCVFKFVKIATNTLWFLTSGTSHQRQKNRNVILITGPCNSGKTRLFYHLQSKTYAGLSTISSLKPNIFKFTPSHLNPESYLAEAIGTDKNTLLELVDFPGHIRLTPELQRYLPRALCILYIIDSSDKIGIKNAAESLYNLFLNPDIIKNDTPFLIICNKSDLPIAKSSRVVEDDILREIEKLRCSRSATLDDDDDNQFLGIEGKVFKFDDLSVPVSICSTSLLTDTIDTIISFLSDVCNYPN